MKPVSLKEARKVLGDLVKAAERGETVVITRRGRKVAEIVAPKPAKPGRLPDLSQFRASIKTKGKSLSRTVSDMRKSERY